ncbi:MAG: hypothetical protein WC829_21055, partial [Hyphomicrobium sp.]
MAQDNNRLDTEEDNARPDPVLPPPGEGAIPTGSATKEPPFTNAAPQQLLPPPIPKATGSFIPPPTGNFIPASPPGGFIPAVNPPELLPPELPRSDPPRSDSPRRELSGAEFSRAGASAPDFAEPQQPQSESPEEQASFDAPAEDSDDDPADGGTPRRRMARRRPAGPSRNRIAANDDGPSIGGLIFALQQKPSNTPFKYAAIASAAWTAFGALFALVSIGSDATQPGLIELVTRPSTFLTIAAIVVPVAMLWLMALLAWRTEELRLRSSTMTEVAIRLAEPDRLAEQNVATLGQAVRRQVGFMNDAISRALGRAGELEAMVHNEVAVLERSYEDNERKIRGLISELSGERHALVNTSDRVSESLLRLGSEIPSLIEKLSDQQVKLSKVIEGAGENLTMLETSLAQSVGNLETSVGGRTEQLQTVLEGYTTALAGALGSRAEQLQTTFDSQLLQLDNSLADRTENLQTVFEEYARALD